MILKPQSELHAGRAGEYLAAADLLLKGHDCFHAAQGMPYDLVVDRNSWLFKIQVKSTLGTRPVPQRKEHIPAYLFWINRCGHEGAKGYSKNEVDLFALVALDTKEVGYIETHRMPRTFCVRSSQHRGQYLDEKIGVRNNSVRLDIAQGMTVSAACAKYQLERSYIHRIKNEPDFVRSKAVYLSDLTLAKALGERE